MAAREDLTQDPHVQRAGECDQVHRRQGLAAHRVDVGEGVGGGDLPEAVRIVHYRGEEVSRLQQQTAAANGMYPASSLVSMPLMEPSESAGASPCKACSRFPGANFDAQPAFVEYFVSLMRVLSSMTELYSQSSHLASEPTDLLDEHIQSLPLTLRGAQGGGHRRGFQQLVESRISLRARVAREIRQASSSQPGRHRTCSAGADTQHALAPPYCLFF